MTQKELLYMEDAICHEESIIKILEEALAKCSGEIENFFENEIIKHQDMKELLMDKLKEKANG